MELHTGAAPIITCSAAVLGSGIARPVDVYAALSPNEPVKTAVRALLLALALAGSGFAGDRREQPSGCGDTVEAALAGARSAGNPETTDICLALAIDRLAARVEALRTGKKAFGEIRARAYLHGEGK